MAKEYLHSYDNKSSFESDYNDIDKYEQPWVSLSEYDDTVVKQVVVSYLDSEEVEHTETFTYDGIGDLTIRSY